MIQQHDTILRRLHTTHHETMTIDRRRLLISCAIFPRAAERHATWYADCNRSTQWSLRRNLGSASHHLDQGIRLYVYFLARVTVRPFKQLFLGDSVAQNTQKYKIVPPDSHCDKCAQTICMETACGNMERHWRSTAGRRTARLSEELRVRSNQLVNEREIASIIYKRK